MATFALAAHSAFMHILLGMTANAFFRRIGINRRLVAGNTSGRTMLTHQWKCRGIVIDFHCFPVFRGVASLTAFAELSFMRIIAPMTGDAAHVELVLV